MAFLATDPVGPQGTLRQRLLVAMGVALAAACVIGILRIAVTLNLPAVYGMDEGWSAFHQAEAIAGQTPYPDASSLMYNVYPPLSFYIVGAFGRLIGDNILAGRILSLVAFLVTALGIAQAVRLMGGRKSAAGFAALVFMTGLLFDHDYVGTNTPQMLAHAFGIVGLVLCLRQPRSARALFFAALFFVLAGFTKHNLVAQPLAVAVWLLVIDRRSALTFILSGAALGAAACVAFQLVFGHSVWSEVHSARIWSAGFAFHALVGRVPEALAPLLASFALLRWFPQDRTVQFCLLYLAIAIGSAAYFIGGAGTGGNMLFDAEIAVALCAGFGLHKLSTRHPAAGVAACYALPLLAVVAFTALTGRFPRFWLDQNAKPVADARQDIAFLKTQQGPVLCRELALCFRAGKTAEADLWNVEQAVVLGRRDGHELRDAIAARRYAVLQLAAPPNVLGAAPELQGPFTRAIAATIQAHYVIHHRDAVGTFWVRRHTP
jgi:4-amino-4-deoxy-L-arabinose transferase-like glycosyltransferase